MNGADWTVRETVARECSNGYYEYAGGIRARYVRVTGGELPYGQPLRISGLRVFGNGEGAKPAQAEAAGARVDALDAKISLAAHRKCAGLQCPLRRCARQALSELAGLRCRRSDPFHPDRRAGILRLRGQL